MKRFASAIALIALFATSQIFTNDKTASDFRCGVVNLKQCLEKSKRGAQETSRLEGLKKQLKESLKKTEGELTDLSKKLQNEDERESLSTTAQKELQGRFEQLNEEYMQAQNQCYQLLNQANYKMLFDIQENVSQASEAVRKKKNLFIIFNKEGITAYLPSLDVTSDVVEEMNAMFDKEAGDKIPSVPATSK